MSNTATQLPYRTNYAELYPVHAECPHCWYNLIRYRMHNEMDQDRFCRNVLVVAGSCTGFNAGNSMTWIISKAIMDVYENSHCSPVPAAEFSEDTCSDGEQSVQLSVICTQYPFWHRDKTTDTSRLSRFGLTYAVLTESHGAELLTWFREGFPARTFPPPGRVPELMEKDPDSREKWRGLSVKYDLATCSWKTAHCLFQEDLPWSSVILPKWGMMRDGELWERMTLADLTSGNDAGSGQNWPTPAARDWKDSPGMSMTGTNPDGSERNRTDQLARAVYHGGTQTRQIYPTPNATDGKGVSQPIGRRPECDDDLPSRINRMRSTQTRQTYPTPTASDYKPRGPNSNQQGLPELVKKNWATPQARDYRTGGADRWNDPNRTRNLNDQAAKTEKGGQLNPDWVEWLMNWPIGWTSLDPLPQNTFREWQQASGIAWTDSAQSETDKYPSPPQQHGEPSQSDNTRNRNPKLTEQADGRSSRSRSYHQYLKRVKHRADRRYAKECLRDLETPIDTTHRYSGYEL